MLVGCVSFENCLISFSRLSVVMSSFNINFKLSGSGDTSCSLNIESKPAIDKVIVAEPLASEPLVESESATSPSVTAVDVGPTKVGKDDVGSSSADSFGTLMSSLDWQRLQQLVNDRVNAPSLAGTAGTDRTGTPSCWSLPLPVPSTRWFDDEVDSFLKETFMSSRD